jgi:hypothetical protein
MTSDIITALALPVTPAIPADVFPGQVILSGYQNSVNQALADLWTDVQAVNTVSGAAVPATRKINTTAPLAGGGDLSADLTVSLVAGSVVLPTRKIIAGAGLTGGGDLSADVTLAVAAGSTVPPARKINTTAPLSGGGDLSADLTLSVNAGAVQSPWIVDVAAAGHTLSNVLTLTVSGRISAGKITAPAYAVDVVGDVNVTGAFRVNGAALPGQTPWLQNINAAGFQLQGAGFIGIGTAAPGVPLDIVGASPQLRVGTALTGQPQVKLGTVSTPYLALLVDDAASKAAAVGLGNPNATMTPGDITLSTYAVGVGWAERMRVLNANGNVGIGTAAPASGLEVATVAGTSTLKAGGIELQTINANVNNVMSNAYYNGSQYVYRATAFAALLQFSSGGFVLYTAPSGNAGATVSWTAAVIVSNSGNVGIGTVSPAFRLDVTGDINTTGLMRSGPCVAAGSTQYTAYNDVGYYCQIGIGGSTSGSANTGFIASNGPISIKGGPTTLTINANGLSVSSGFVGIGTPSPSYAIDLTGTTPNATCIKSQNSVASSFASVLLLNDTGTYMQMGCGGSTYATYAGWGWLSSPGGIQITAGAMTLYTTPNGLGIGGSPSYKLDVAGTINGQGALRMPALPSTNPGAGTKQFWYDPADGNRVKYAP